MLVADKMPALLHIVCIAVNACICDAIAYRQCIATDSCLALNSAYDQKHAMQDEVVVMLLRTHG